MLSGLMTNKKSMDDEEKLFVNCKKELIIDTNF
jgi:hypothetical protein